MQPITKIEEYLSREGNDAPTDAERAFIEAMRKGEPCILGNGTRPDTPGPDRTTRSGLLRVMIAGGTTDCETHNRGMRLVGAFIPDTLDIDFIIAKGMTSFECCTFAYCLSATQAEFQFLNLSGCYLPRLCAERSVIRGNLFLQSHGSNLLEVPGGVDIAGVHIGGQLSCSGAILGCGQGRALNAQGAKISDSVFLIKGRSGLPFVAKGEVSFSGSTIGGQLSGTGGRFVNPGGMSFNAERAAVHGGIFLHATDEATRFEADGEVCLRDAEIGGQLACGGGLFHNPGGFALVAESTRVSGSVFLHALSEELRFESVGEVSLAGSDIKGQLACRGGRFRRGKRFAITIERTAIGGSAEFSAFSDRTRFEAEGEVRLSGAAIEGQLSFSGARLASENDSALTADRLRVKGNLVWRNVHCVSGHISLGSAHVAGLSDDIPSWPDNDRLYLDGFTYDRIVYAATDARSRLDWLARGSTHQGEFFPQPYVQLAKVLFGQGHRRDARKIQMARERLTRSAQRRDFRQQVGIFGLPILPILWLWSQALRLAVGYGYAPWRALVALVTLWAFTAWLAGAAWDEGSFAPNSGVILISEGWRAIDAADCHGGAPEPGCVVNPAQEWSARNEPGMDWDSFSRYGYAADLVVPVLSLGQTDAWAPSKERGPYGRALWWGRWVIVGLGWIIALLATAAVTGVIRRDEEAG